MNRRELLALAGASAASSALPAGRAAASERSESAPYTFFDPGIPASRRFAHAAGRAVAIDGDLRMQWRNGLGAACGQATPVAALVRWSDATVLANLLKENRRTASIDPVPAEEDGGSLFLLRA